MTSSPSNSPLQTMPRSGMAPASEPASGPVRPKQGNSEPSASPGNQRSFCSWVPYFTNNSPGPRELGTMAVTAAAMERLAIFPITLLWA